MPATDDLRIDWNNDGDYSDTGENVTSRVLADSTLTVEYGRDQARALSPMASGRMAFELNNRSRDYSPENTASPLAGNVLPARRVRWQRTLSAVTYTMFQGFLDDFDVLPDLEQRSVRISCLDALARLRDTKISTTVYQGIRTGTAIGLVLDAIGWPATDRDLDPGATLIRFWWEDDTDAWQAVERLLNSEGPPSICYVDPDGKFVFRDRHHRLLRAASTTSQATFRGSGAEPLMSPPLVYDHGWRGVVNSITYSVGERAPAGELAVVWSSDETINLSEGQTIEITAQATDPFIGAVTPEAVVPSDDPDQGPGADYTLLSGAVTFMLSRTTGASTTIRITATLGAGPVVLRGLRLRAYPVPVVTTVKVAAEDSSSIAKYGDRSPSQDAPWVNRYDAEAIAHIMLAQRAERLPVVSMRLISGSDTRLTQQLARDLSDRVTIIEPETGLSDDFYIERAQHTVSHGGLIHETVFGCEKVAPVVDPVFRFDTAGAGFDDGKFGDGQDDPSNLFIFDVAGHGFDDGVFAT